VVRQAFGASRARSASYACKMYVITLVVIGLLDNQFPGIAGDIVHIAVK
jgi:hypothetical protein